MNYQNLLNYIDAHIVQQKTNENDLRDIKNIVSDEGYFAFINKSNGGSLFEDSLQIYSIGKVGESCDVVKINEIIRREYDGILSNEFFFGQDIFGNQFGFGLKGIILFNIETGEKQTLASDFNNWIEIIFSDLDFYTGRNVMKSWNNFNPPLRKDERLCPKKPFIIGGEYQISNLYPLAFPKYLLVNSNIARQIVNLPDGTSIKLKLDN